MEQVPAPINNSTTTASSNTTTATTRNGYSRAHIAVLAKRLKVNMQNILQKVNASQRVALSNSTKENVISTTLMSTTTIATTSAYRQPLMQTPPKDNNTRLTSPIASPILSVKDQTTKKNLPLLTPSSSLDPHSASPPNRRSTNISSRTDNQRQCTPFTRQPANHIYLGINASTEQFPVIGGPAVGEFIANGPILISTAMKESQHATPTKPSVTLVNKKRPLEQSSQVSGNSKKKRVNISRSSSTIDSSTLWDSDDTDTDTETNNLIKKHMVSFVQAPNTPSPARTKLPLTHRNTLSDMNISKVGPLAAKTRQQVGSHRSPSKSTTMNATKKNDYVNTSYTPVVSIPQRDHSAKSRNTIAKPYVAIRSTPTRRTCQATRVRAVLVTGASEFDLANRSNGKNKSRSLSALPPPLLPKLHDARTMTVPAMTDINGQYINKKPLPRLIPSISHTPNIILCRYCRKSCKGTHGCTMHWKHCEVKALAVDIKMANLRNDQFRCPCMIRKTDKTAYHLKQSMSQHRTEAIRCPKCQMYAHIDCIWALGQSYPTQYTCPLCEISLTEKQIVALHDASRSTKKRVKEYENHLKQLHRVVKNYCLSSTRSVPLPPPPPPSFTSSDTTHSIYDEELSEIDYHINTGNRYQSHPGQLMARSKMSWLSTIDEAHYGCNEEASSISDYSDEIASDTNTSFTDSISDDEAAIFYEGDESDDDADDDDNNNEDNVYSLYQHSGRMPYIDSSSISSTSDAYTLSPLALHLNCDPSSTNSLLSLDPFLGESNNELNTNSCNDDEWSDPSNQLDLLHWLDNEKNSLAMLANTQCLNPLAITSTDTAITATPSTSMMTCSDPWISSVSATTTTDIPSNTDAEALFINKEESLGSMETIDINVEIHNSVDPQQQQQPQQVVSNNLSSEGTNLFNHDDIWTLDMGEQITELFNTFINPDMVH